jgi:DNA-binding response OmpR family regulator
MSAQILLADDERSVRQLLELVLSKEGYEVRVTHNGDELVRAAQDQVPDLIIADLMMPILDGYEAIRQLRNDTRTAHVPMMIVTAKSGPDDVVTGFETGADDYITKPFNIPELIARIKGLLRRASAQPVRNPLTGLPGNILLNEEIRYRLKNESPFAMLYIDLDNFKSFNDTYGPARGDRVIKLVAELLLEVIQHSGSKLDFIGHIGGDDFAVLTTPDTVRLICMDLIADFDQRVRALYDEPDLERGYLMGVDRQGIPRRFPIISISIGVVTNVQRSFVTYEDVSRIASEMKAFAKQQVGSSFAVDGRVGENRIIQSDRRGLHTAGVLLVCADSALRVTLMRALADTGYRVFEATGITEAHAVFARQLALALVVLDARLGEDVWELVRIVARQRQPTVILMLSDSATDEHSDTDRVQYLRRPFEIAQFVERVGFVMTQSLQGAGESSDLQSFSNDSQ